MTNKELIKTYRAMCKKLKMKLIKGVQVNV